MPREHRSVDEAFEAGEDPNSTVNRLLGISDEGSPKPKPKAKSLVPPVEEEEEEETETPESEDEGFDDDDEDGEEEPEGDEAEEEEEPEEEPEDPELDFRNGLPPGVRKRLKVLTEKRNKERDRAAIAEAKATELAAEVERLRADREDMLAAAKDPEPHLDPEDPDTVIAWREWKDRESDRKVAAATRDKQRADAEAAPAGDVNSDLARAIGVAQKKHPDYARVVSKAVQAKIDNDPALYDRVWFDAEGRSAPEVAYEIGLELLGRKKKPEAEEPAQRKPRSTASGGYRGSAGKQASKKLSNEERAAMRMMNMSEKEYLEARDEQAI